MLCPSIRVRVRWNSKSKPVQGRVPELGIMLRPRGRQKECAPCFPLDVWKRPPIHTCLTAEGERTQIVALRLDPPVAEK